MSNSRGTGRTTALLDQAKRLTDEGRAVYILAAHGAHRRFILDKLEGRGDIISVETPESLVNFDWDAMEMVGSHPNCVVLIDHFTYEQKIMQLQNKIRSLEEVAKIKDELYRVEKEEEEEEDPRLNLTQDDLVLGMLSAQLFALVASKASSGFYGATPLASTMHRYIAAAGIDVGESKV